MGVIKGQPPFELVQLSTIPEEEWIGLPVFHPCCQIGETIYWRLEDVPFWADGDDTGTMYDAGVVTKVFERNQEYPDETRVFFIGSCGSTLQYSVSNLWTPRRYAKKE